MAEGFLGRRSVATARGLVRRPAPACALLLAAYVLLSLANDPGGFLGTDTGGKVATLRAMTTRGTLDPDVGYWAEQWDPEGRLHPLMYTARVGSRWVNASTLPALIAAYPLYRVGGYRLALLVPMLGSIAAALAARALARRLHGGDGWLAFWLTGLASPLAVYALDFWEHSLGVALVGWAVVVLFDLLARARPAAGASASALARRGAVAGVLFGTAATMRQEALVYAAAAAGVTALALLAARRRLVAACVVVGAVAIGLVLPLTANLALERVAVGADIRGARVTGTAQEVGRGLGTRVHEGILTAVGLDPDPGAGSWVVGAAAAVLIIVAARRSGAGRRRDHGIAGLALAGAGALYAVRFAGGLAFVPGMLAATPVAAVGLAVPGRLRRLFAPGPAGDPPTGTAPSPDSPPPGRPRPHRPAHPPPEQDVECRAWVTSIALIAVPVVWAFQYPGGASPQWGGRYVLATGFLLAVVGAVTLPRVAWGVRVTIIALAVTVTLFGLAWLAVRSHDVARAAAALEQRTEPVVVSRWGHLAREGGAFSGTAGDHRWLTAVTDDDLRQAVAVVRAAGAPRFAYVDVSESGASLPPPPSVEAFVPIAHDRIAWIPGLVLRVVTYERDGE